MRIVLMYVSSHDASLFYFCFNDTATTEIYTYLHTLSLHDALPIYAPGDRVGAGVEHARFAPQRAIDEPGAGGAAHAVGEHGDLASALDGMHVLVQQVVAIPGREVHRTHADLAGRRAAQLGVVAPVGLAEPPSRAARLGSGACGDRGWR